MTAAPHVAQRLHLSDEHRSEAEGYLVCVLSGGVPRRWQVESQHPTIDAAFVRASELAARGADARTCVARMIAVYQGRVDVVAWYE